MAVIISDSDSTRKIISFLDEPNNRRVAISLARMVVRAVFRRVQFSKEKMIKTTARTLMK